LLLDLFDRDLVTVTLYMALSTHHTEMRFFRDKKKWDVCIQRNT